ncbi:MAG TPA: hypothetical protein VMW27_27205 [Thermoanaerobaculia bacterium]|nr:hypothetical protein [Thermoanaerobaculia bacterium]
MLQVPIPSIIAAQIVRTDRKIVRDLRDAGATTSERATLLEPGRHLRRRRIKRLEGIGAVRRAGDRYYLDEAAWEAYQSRRRRRILIAMILVVIAFLITVWLTSGSAQ